MNTKLEVEQPHLKNRRGAMLVFLAISMLGLLGLVAIATDVGAGNRQRRIAQTAADAGAIGGGRVIERKGDSASVVASALLSASKNLFSASEVSVFYPPASGPHTGDRLFVEVKILKKVPTLFGGIFNKDSIQIQARAVAGLGSISTQCVYNLATNPTLGINWDGKMTTNCGVASNGSVYLKKDISGGDVSAVGTVSGVSDVNQRFPNSPPVFDPFSYLTVPAETSCDFNNTVISSNATLDSGVYCGGITVNNNITATLRKGTYIIRGGGITGGQIEATTGVTIINTNGMGNNQATYKPFVFGNNCSFHLYAPTTGPWKGIAVFTPSTVPAAANETDRLNDFCGKGTNTPCSASDPDIRGLVYMPNQAFVLSNSNAKMTIAGTFITKFMTSSGGAEACVFLDTTGSTQLLRLSLVE